MRVLVSGASIAGPVLAYWLARYGFSVTVVERAGGPRKSGGHAVDLFRPAVDISEKMGVLGLIEGRVTGTDRMALFPQGAARAARVDLSKIFGAASERHAEIMRGRSERDLLRGWVWGCRVSVRGLDYRDFAGR